MKLIILLAVASLARCDKLDRTYLPPVHAQTSGGSENFLQTPNFSNQPEASGFGQNGNGFTQNGNYYGLAGNVIAQGGNGFAQAGNGFSQNGNDFTQNGNDFSQNGNDFAQNDASNFQRAERPRAAFERTASILRQDSQNDGETYSYSFETENGISAEESGVATNGVEAQGGFSYIGDDGQVYSVRYTADQNGFVPQGDHLPTPPPIPEEILKALEQNARDEANGIFDDGSFQEGKYANSEADGNQDYNGNQNYNTANQNNAGNQNFGGNFNDNSFARDDETIITNSAAANNAYLPPFADESPVLNQRPETPDQRPQKSNQRQNTAVTNSYLPPLGNQGLATRNQRPEISNQRPQNGNQRQNTAVTNSYLPPLGNQAPASRNQRPEISNQKPQNGNQRQNPADLTSSYLPPLDNQRAVIRNQISSTGIQRQTIANTAYLPPLDNQRAASRRGPQVDQSNFAVPQNTFGSNDVTNAYLPPKQSRRPASFNTLASPQKSSNSGFASSTSNGFGQRSVQRRPSYNARDGYQY